MWRQMFNDLVEECRAKMIHDNMDISGLMVHEQQVEKSRLKKENRVFKRAKSYERGSSKGRLEVKTSLGSRRGFPTKFPSISLRKIRIRCLIVSPKRKEVEIHLARNILVLSVVRNIGVSV